MSIVEQKLKHFTESISKSLSHKNYYAALSMALILPDICSKLETPDQSTNKRYPNWFNRYVGEHYTSYSGPQKEKHVFLSGQDAYSLRCSFIHQGESDISQQFAQDVLSNFTFIEPPQNAFVHNNQINDTLQLQVDVFCNDICSGVEKWIEENIENDEINTRASKIMEITQI